MAGQELTHEWNEVFPSAPITKNDLANPTEAFLTNALVTLLRTISINVNTSEFDPASNDQETIRKNKLCLFQYVNDMYRSLHNKKFHYFDLVHPSEYSRVTCDPDPNPDTPSSFQLPRRR